MRHMPGPVVWGLVVFAVALVGCRGTRRQVAETSRLEAGTKAGAEAAKATDPVQQGPFVSLPRRGWARRLGGPGSDVGSALLWHHGNVYVTGHFSGVAEMGDASLTSAGGEDLFVASFSGTGHHQWSRRVGGSDADHGEDLVVNEEGNLVLAGFVTGLVDLGLGMAQRQGQWTGFVASYTKTGDWRSSQTLGKHPFWPADLIRAPNGGYYMAGSFQQAVKQGDTILTSAGEDDGFLVSTTKTFAPRWARSLGAAGDDGIEAVAVDGAGNIYAVGTFHGALSHGNESVLATGHSDLLVASFSPAGTTRWLRSYGGEQSDEGAGIVVGSEGNIYVTGRLRRPGFYHGRRPTVYDDVFLASLTPAGDERWAHRFQTRTGSGNDLATKGRDICLTGSFSGALDLGGHSLYSNESPDLAKIPGGGEPHTDIFVACFSQAGAHRWSSRFGGTSADGGNALVSGPEGALFVTGWLTGNADFAGQTLTGAGDSDGFLLKILPTP